MRAAAVMALLLAVSPARADAGSDSATILMLTPASRQQALAPVADAVRGQLLDLPVAMEVAAVQGAPEDREAWSAAARRSRQEAGAILVFWIEPGPPPLVVLLLDEGNDVRRVERAFEGVGTGAGREAAGLIVRSVARSVLQRLEGNSGGGVAEDAEQCRVPPVPEAPQRGRSEEQWRWLSLEVGYAFQVFSDRRTDTHAVQLGLTVNLHEYWCLLLGYRVFLHSISGSSESASTRLRRFPTSLGTRLRYRWSDLELAANLLVTLDYTDTQTLAPELGINRDQSDFQLTVLPGLHLAYRLVPRLWLLLELGVEIVVNNKAYGVLGKQGREVLLDPWKARPQIAIGLGGELF